LNILLYIRLQFNINPVAHLEFMFLANFVSLTFHLILSTL
jgi:hypothetical protein